MFGNKNKINPIHIYGFNFVVQNGNALCTTNLPNS